MRGYLLPFAFVLPTIILGTPCCSSAGVNAYVYSDPIYHAANPTYPAAPIYPASPIYPTNPIYPVNPAYSPVGNDVDPIFYEAPGQWPMNYQDPIMYNTYSNALQQLDRAIHGVHDANLHGGANVLRPGLNVLNPGANLLRPGLNVLTPGAPLLPPGANLLTPGASLLTPGANLLTPVANLLSPGVDSRAAFDEAIHELDRNVHRAADQLQQPVGLPVESPLQPSLAKLDQAMHNMDRSMHNGALGPVPLAQPPLDYTHPPGYGRYLGAVGFAQPPNPLAVLDRIIHEVDPLASLGFPLDHPERRMLQASPENRRPEQFQLEAPCAAQDRAAIPYMNRPCQAILVDVRTIPVPCPVGSILPSLPAELPRTTPDQQPLRSYPLNEVPLLPSPPSYPRAPVEPREGQPPSCPTEQEARQEEPSQTDVPSCSRNSPAAVTTPPPEAEQPCRQQPVPAVPYSTYVGEPPRDNTPCEKLDHESSSTTRPAQVETPCDKYSVPPFEPTTPPSPVPPRASTRSGYEKLQIKSKARADWDRLVGKA